MAFLQKIAVRTENTGKNGKKTARKENATNQIQIDDEA